MGQWLEKNDKISEYKTAEQLSKGLYEAILENAGRKTSKRENNKPWYEKELKQIIMQMSRWYEARAKGHWIDEEKFRNLQKEYNKECRRKKREYWNQAMADIRTGSTEVKYVLKKKQAQLARMQRKGESIHEVIDRRGK